MRRAPASRTAPGRRTRARPIPRRDRRRRAGRRPPTGSAAVRPRPARPSASAAASLARPCVPLEVSDPARTHGESRGGRQDEQTSVSPPPVRRPGGKGRFRRIVRRQLTFSKDSRRLPLGEVLIWTAMSIAMQTPLEEVDVADARRAALTYLSEAFALALLDGIDADAFVQAALCAPMCELVAAHG